jgi:ABC-type transport system involved in cytochrome c biogenesis permease subunit
MTHTEQLTIKTFFTPEWRKHLLIGAGIALLVVCFFVIAAGKGNPAWGDYWRIKPLLLSPFLGAITGLCYDVTAPLRRLDGWLGKLFLALSLLGFFIGQWLSLVLGLNGTMWN